MSTKLFEVSAEIRVLVMAESAEDAEELAATQYFEAEVNEQSGVWTSLFENVTASEVTEEKQIPEPWEHAIPWGGDGERTCGQIIAANKRLTQ